MHFIFKIFICNCGAEIRLFLAKNGHFWVFTRKWQYLSTKYKNYKSKTTLLSWLYLYICNFEDEIRPLCFNAIFGKKKAISLSKSQIYLLQLLELSKIKWLYLYFCDFAAEIRASLKMWKNASFAQKMGLTWPTLSSSWNWTLL